VFNIKQEETMKKTYINPEMEIIKIASQQQMLAGSTIPTGSTPTDPSLTDAHEGFTFDDDAFDFGAEESISNFE
jgi:hypothetical protein